MIPRCIPVRASLRISILTRDALLPSPLLMRIQLLLLLSRHPLTLPPPMPLLHIAHNILDSIMTSRIRILRPLTRTRKIRRVEKPSHRLRDTVLEFRCSTNNLLDTASQKLDIFLLPELP